MTLSVTDSITVLWFHTIAHAYQCLMNSAKLDTDVWMRTCAKKGVRNRLVPQRRVICMVELNDLSLLVVQHA